MYFLGAPLNVLCLIVFFKQGLKDRMNFSLFSLSLVDLLYTTSLSTFSMYCYVTEEENHDLKESLQWYVRKYFSNIMFGFRTSSGCLTAIIAVERCLCVVFPMKAMTLIKTRTMVLLIAGSVVIVQSLCLVYTLKNQVTTVTDIATGKKGLVWTRTELYKQHRSLFDIIDFVVLPTVTLSSFFVVSVSTAVTVVKLTQAMTWRQNTSSTAGDKRQMMLVKMLVTVSCIYVTCTAPMVALTFARFLVDGFSTTGRYRNIFYASYAIGNLIMMLNSSVNFFVYVTQSSRFKMDLVSLFPCRKGPGTDPKMSEISISANTYVA
nr:hypothetical protein BaRGS_013879 [Batillaria attramentaria]